MLYIDRFEQMYNDMYLSLGIIQRIFSALKVLCTPHIHPISPPLIIYLGNHWSFYHLHNFSFSRMSYSWKHTIYIILVILYVASQIGFFHLVICIWGSFKSFHDLIACSFLVLNNIPLSGCTTVYLSIHLLKDILVTSKFWQLWIKLL